MNPEVSVMVTGVGGGGHGEQILKALRLSDRNYSIVGSDISAMSKGLRDVDHPYVVPAASDPTYIASILEICKRHRVKALFHGSEPELKVLARNRVAIEREGIFLPINPDPVVDLCMNKSRTMVFLKENGFSYPETANFRSAVDLAHWDLFPAIVKPSVGAGGSAHTMIVQNRHELEVLSDYMIRLAVCPEVIVQEYKGTPESEYTVGVLFDMDGGFVNSIAIRRNLDSSLSCRLRVPNRTGRSEFGENLVISTGISQGAIGKFPEVTDTCEQIARMLGARGSINIQCRIHEGKVYTFEINPRFSGTTSLRALVGYNEPDLLIRKHVLGESIPSKFSYAEGVVVRGLDGVFIR